MLLDSASRLEAVACAYDLLLLGLSIHRVVAPCEHCRGSLFVDNAKG